MTVLYESAPAASGASSHGDAGGASIFGMAADGKRACRRINKFEVKSYSLTIELL